ncbi:unnamed protein product [Boreogadus saida]
MVANLKMRYKEESGEWLLLNKAALLDPRFSRPLPCGYTGTMEATTLVLLVLLDCLFVSSSRPFHSSSGGPPMVCNFIKSDVEES